MCRPTLLVPMPPTDIPPKLVATACELARGMGADIEVLTVVPALDAVDPHTTLSPSDDAVAKALDHLATSTRAALAGPLAELEAAAQEVRVQVIHGGAVDAILARAHEIAPHYLVMGTAGRSGMRRAMLGSVAEGVLRKAPCPVVVVPPGA